ncbi:gas vesicle protein [Halobacillus sp. A1]|uniref:Gas vesicle protein n=1 Tax=Halobacillus campisalis TaxID=435909 RepID=A0ABW2K188_9BACI|nr:MULTISPECIES: gas vesicle protein [Halobacillus]MCP3032210.1 gas vesicle protein [Halobacillus sp. A1]
MSHRETYQNKEIGLIDILDTVLDKGVAIKGDLIISIAGIDLVYLDLRVLISAVETLVQSNMDSDSLTSKRFDQEKEDLTHVTEQS